MNRRFEVIDGGRGKPKPSVYVVCPGCLDIAPDREKPCSKCGRYGRVRCASRQQAEAYVSRMTDQRSKHLA